MNATIEVGTVIKINHSIGTILKIQDGLVLVKWANGCQTCYGITGIRPSQIINTESKQLALQL